MGVRIIGEGFDKLRNFEAAIPGISRDAVEQAALTTKRVVLEGAPARLRNVGRSGSRLNVRYDIRGTENPTALVRATGPWQIIEGPTKAHDITPRRRRGARAVSTPQGPRRIVHHPGTHGKFPWKKGVATSAPLSSRAFAAKFHVGMSRYFKG